MRITLHNHKFIDSEDKPLISNADFKLLVEATRIVFTLKHKFTLEKRQEFIIEDLSDHNSINKRINYPELF
jgi:hypothetical protein